MFVYELIRLLVDENYWKMFVKLICQNLPKDDSSVVLMSLNHRDDLALKSLTITEKYDLRFFMLIKSFSKLDKSQIHHYTG